MNDANHNTAIRDPVEDDLDAIPCGILSTKLDGTIVRVNEPFVAMTGLSRATLLGGMCFQDLLTKAGKMLYETHFLPLLLVQGHVNAFSCQLNYDGQEALHIHLNSNLKHSDTGDTPLIRTAMFNASDRARYEQELRRKRSDAQELAAIVTASRDAIVTVGIDAIVRSWNPGATATFGYAENEAIGKSIVDLVIPEYNKSTVPGIYVKLRAGETVVLPDTERHRKDGTVISVEVTATPMPDEDGVVTGASLVFRDITERKRYETYLKRSQETALKLIEVNPFGVYLVDTNFRIAQASVGARKAFAGIDPLIGRDFAEVVATVWPEPFATHVIQKFRHTLETGEPYRAPDTTQARADLEKVESYDWQIERVQMPDNRFGVVCHFYDTTERVKYQQHVAMLMGEVNHRSKNLLSVVEAIARQTSRSSDPATFALRFSERIRALAASQDLLVKNQWLDISLSDLVKSQMQTFVDVGGKRIEASGPPIFMSPAAAQGIGMALHELATNAVKYGALSNQEGKVLIDWHTNATDEPLFKMQWREVGGPKVAPVKHTGFGHVVVKRMIEAAINGTVEIDYHPVGLHWVLQTPVANLQKTKTDS